MNKKYIQVGERVKGKVRKAENYELVDFFKHLLGLKTLGDYNKLNKPWYITQTKWAEMLHYHRQQIARECVQVTKYLIDQDKFGKKKRGKK